MGVTKDRLVSFLVCAHAPADLIAGAKHGQYDEIESGRSDTQEQLVLALTNAGLVALARMAKEGEFDNTDEEWLDWAKSEPLHFGH